jgi:helix-hairpin-helix protein/phasin protein
MAKVNVNSATRDDLVNVAGLRPDIADAVLEFRRKHHRISDAQALEELPGVGPATVEQLREALDFGDKGGNGHARARAAEAASSAARGGAEATRHAAESGARVASTTAREGTEIVRQVFGAAETGREEAGRAAEGAAELGRLWVDLLGEQTRHNLEVATALGRAVRWAEVIEAQAEFVRVSLERFGELNRGYLEIIRGMAETVPAAAERARKAG